MGSDPIREQDMMESQTHNYTQKVPSPEKDLCLVSDVFLKLENIKPNKIKVSEMGK